MIYRYLGKYRFISILSLIIILIFLILVFFIDVFSIPGSDEDQEKQSAPRELRGLFNSDKNSSMPEIEFSKQYFRERLFGNKEKALNLVRKNKLIAIRTINTMLDGYVDQILASNTEFVKSLLYMTAQLASDFQRVFLNGYYMKRVVIYRNWSREQMQQKVYGDKLDQEAEALRKEKKYQLELTKRLECEKIYLAIGERLRAAYVQREVGHILKILGKRERALTFYQKAANLFQEAKNLAEEARALNNIGTIYLDFGKTEKAMSVLLNAVAKVKIENYKELEANILNNLVVVYRKTGEYQRALELAQEVLSLYKSLNIRKGEANILVNIGNIYYDLNKYESALASYKKALKIFEILDLKQEKAKLLINIRSVLLMLGRSEEGLKKNEETKQFINELKDDIDRNTWSMNQALMQNVYNAVTTYENLVEKHRKSGNKYNEAVTLINLGGAYVITALQLSEINPLRKTYFEKALKKYLESVILAREIGAIRVLAIACYSAGQKLEYFDRFEEAKNYYEESIQCVESLRARLSKEKLSLHFFKGRSDAYEAIIQLLLELHALNKVPHDPNDLLMGSTFEEIAFHYSERLKTRTFLEILARQRQDYVPPLSRALSEKEAELIKNLQKYEANIGRHTAYNEVLVRLRKIEYNKIKDELERLISQIKRDYPRYAALKYPEAVTLKEIDLQKGEVLLVYSVMKSSTHLFVVNNSRLIKSVKISKSREELIKYIREFRQPLEDFNKLNDFNPALAHKLYKLLLAKGLEGISTEKHLIIVPDGILNLLPFEALIVNKDQIKRVDDKQSKIVNYKGVEYLGDLWTISYYPSATVLAINRASGLLKKVWAYPFFAVADPIFGNQDSRYAKLLNQKGEAVNRKKSTDRSLLFSFFKNKRRGSGFRLPETREEVLMIAKIFGLSANSEHIRLGKNANETAIKAFDLSSYQYLHFATHGILRDDSLYGIEPCLVFNLGGNKKDDGFLEMSEVLGLRMRADLVTLSACQTGLGSDICGEGLVGFSRAFMLAGARSLLVSLWSVESSSTSILMKSFYTYLKSGKNKAEALRLAKLDLKNGQFGLRSRGIEIWYGNKIVRTISGAHPYFWAPFILIGEQE